MFVCLFVVLDHNRTSSAKGNLSTTGEGKEFGLLIGIGPGLTMECSVLKAMPLAKSND
jgi:chalcone synthase